MTFPAFLHCQLPPCSCPPGAGFRSAPLRSKLESKDRLQRNSRPWGTDRACGQRPPVPNVAFSTYKKTSSLSCLPAACLTLLSESTRKLALWHVFQPLVASWLVVSCFLPLVACNWFLLLASSFLFSCFLPLLLVMTSWPLLLVIPPLTRSPCCKRGRRIYSTISYHVWYHIILYIPRSSFVALFSGRLGCWLLFEISVRKSSSWPKRLLLQFTYDFPGFISCCITMLHIQPHPILFQLNSLMWAIDKTKWCNDKWPANRQCQPPPTLYPPQANKIETLNSDQPC